MDQVLHQLVISTPGAGFTRLNEELNTWIRGSGIHLGVVHLTCLHTSARLPVKLTQKQPDPLWRLKSCRPKSVV